VFIDEAQRIKVIGLTAKIITDQFKEVQLVISGSSALEINQSTKEPLTGRKFEYQLYPKSWEEFENHVGYVEASTQLEERNGKLHAFNFKRQRRGKNNIPASFLNTYGATGTIIDKDNFRSFVTTKSIFFRL
jgi:predicted AAA+ superfamily ATPase